MRCKVMRGGVYMYMCVCVCTHACVCIVMVFIGFMSVKHAHQTETRKP
jgi:uncharacterized membrane protein